MTHRIQNRAMALTNLIGDPDAACKIDADVIRFVFVDQDHFVHACMILSELQYLRIPMNYRATGPLELGIMFDD